MNCVISMTLTLTLISSKFPHKLHKMWNFKPPTFILKAHKMKQHVYEHVFFSAPYIILSSLISLHASILVVPNFYSMPFSYPVEFLHLLPMNLFTCGMFQIGIFEPFQQKRSIL